MISLFLELSERVFVKKRERGRDYITECEAILQTLSMYFLLFIFTYICLVISLFHLRKILAKRKLILH